MGGSASLLSVRVLDLGGFNNHCLITSPAHTHLAEFAKSYANLVHRTSTAPADTSLMMADGVLLIKVETSRKKKKKKLPNLA